jgi:hypothetical protein
MSDPYSYVKRCHFSLKRASVERPDGLGKYYKKNKTEVVDLLINQRYDSIVQQQIKDKKAKEDKEQEVESVQE